MKKSLLLSALLMSVFALFGQTDQPTYGYSYQAIIRDGDGKPLGPNQIILLRARILNSADTVQYEETHTAVTDTFGRVAVVIGTGAASVGKFDTLNWAAQKHFLNVAVKLSGMAGFKDLGKEEIVLQPFAGNSGDWVNVGDTVLYRLNGNIGVGTLSPESRFHVNGATFLNQGSLAGAKSQKPGLQIRQHSDIAHPNQTSFEVVGGVTDLSPKKFRIFTDGGDPWNLKASFDGNFIVNGTTRTKVLEITGGDVAEARHPVEGYTIEPGMVVVFDETEQGKVRPTTRPYDKKAAGVVSGKGKYFAGVCLLEGEIKKGALPIAQVGTVEVLAVGPVEVGDLLTTSETPGYAVAVKDPYLAFGAVIGKSTTSLKAGEKGVVEMWVERH